MLAMSGLDRHYDPIVENMQGLWTIHFASSSPNGQPGTGVVVFTDDKILGGDAGYFYVGVYEELANTIRAKVRIKPFVPSYSSIFGNVGQELTLILTGDLADGVVEGHGYAMEIPSAKLKFRLTKVA